MTRRTSPAGTVPPLLLYDGVCGLCDAFVQFVLRRDAQGEFLYAALQSPAAARRLAEAARAPEALPDSLVLIEDGTVHVRSDAALRVIRRLPGWGVAGAVALLVPRPVRDAVYDFVARHRYRVFGRKDHCPLPDPATRARFLWD